MLKKFSISLAVVIILLASFTIAFAGLTKQEELGQLLYFDRYLSANQNQSCSSCHDPSAGMADPLNLRLPEVFATSAGSETALFGGRNAPTAKYAMFSPPFSYIAQFPEGGQFWDGRATGGDPTVTDGLGNGPTFDALVDQAKGPFLNPVEMNMGTQAAVIGALKDPSNPNALRYQELFNKIYKINLANLDLTNDAAVWTAYDAVALAIAAFEKTEVFAPFTSKFDAVTVGAENFTADEAAGEILFNDVATANCAACHPGPIFTDFSYDNLGIPQNPLHSAKDPGLGAGENPMIPTADLALVEGLFKVSNLRNLPLTAPYGHNGYFPNPESIVQFYNTRDVYPCPTPLGGYTIATPNELALGHIPGYSPGAGALVDNGYCWDVPEFGDTVNADELGNLGLTPLEVDQIVSFLKTLSDRTDAKSYPPMF